MRYALTIKGRVQNDTSPIPMTFARLQTDTLEDIGRKLDKGGCSSK